MQCKELWSETYISGNKIEWPTDGANSFASKIPTSSASKTHNDVQSMEDCQAMCKEDSCQSIAYKSGSKECNTYSSKQTTSSVKADTNYATRNKKSTSVDGKHPFNKVCLDYIVRKQAFI